MTLRLGIPIGLLVGIAAGGALTALAREVPARPRLCPEDAPEGVRLPPRPGCGTRDTSAAKHDTGFRAIIPGTDIRIGGRAGASFDARR